MSKPIRSAELFAVLDRLLAGRPGSGPPGHSPPEHEHIVDPHALLAACDDDPVLLDKLIHIFRNNAPGSLARVHEAIARQDPAHLRESAHQLRGLLSTFSPKAAQDAALLEAMGAGGELGDAAAAFQDARRSDRAAEATPGKPRNRRAAPPLAASSGVSSTDYARPASLSVW